MLQKIMVVALMLAVAGMAVVTYFTWSATREITAQMAGISKETRQQVEEMTRKIGQPNIVQSVPQPRLRIFCCSGSRQQPVAGYTVTVRSIDYVGKEELKGRTFTREYLTDPSGWIDTGPMQQGMYELTGTWEAAVDGQAFGPAHWSRTVRLQQMGQVEEALIEVPATAKYEIRLQGSVLKYWDVARMPTVYLSVGGRVPMPNECSSDWRLDRFPIRAAGTTVVTGLRSGRVGWADLRFPSLDQKDRYSQSISLLRPTAPIEIPQGGGTVDIVVSSPGEHVSGTVRLDDKGAPARGVRVDVAHEGGTECLIADDRGHFESPFADLAHGSPTITTVRIGWHNANGQDAAFEYEIDPHAAPCEIDLSKMAALKVQFFNVEKLQSLVPDPQKPAFALFFWSRRIETGDTCTVPKSERGHPLTRDIKLDSSATTDQLVLAGSYDMGVEGLYQGSSRVSSPSQFSLAVDVHPNDVRVLQIDVEKLLPSTQTPVPPRPGARRNRGRNERAILPAGPTDSGPSEQATTAPSGRTP